MGRRCVHSSRHLEWVAPTTHDTRTQHTDTQTHNLDIDRPPSFQLCACVGSIFNVCHFSLRVSACPLSYAQRIFTSGTFPERTRAPIRILTGVQGAKLECLSSKTEGHTTGNRKLLAIASEFDILSHCLCALPRSMRLFAIWFDCAPCVF